MRKTVRNLFIAFAAMLGVSACNFDMVDTYTFYDQVYIQTEEEEKANQIEGYFREVIDFDKNETFHGRQFDAITYGQSGHRPDPLDRQGRRVRRTGKRLHHHSLSAGSRVTPVPR